MPFLEVQGKSLFVHTTPATENSAQDGLSILAIHGLGSSHTFFLPLFEVLAGAGLTCIAYDTFGSSLSIPRDRNSIVTQDVASMSNDMRAIMQTLKLEASRTILIGHSMGGMVACDVASKTRFKYVVLLGPVHPTPGAARVFAKRIETVQAAGMEAMADVIPQAATGSKSTPVQRAWIRSLLLSQDVHGYISLCRVIANASAPDYASILSPMLVIAGAEDKSAPLEGCRHIVDSAGTDSSDKSLEVLEGVGHWHGIEAPEQIGRIIGDRIGVSWV